MAKKKIKKVDPYGIIHIQSSFNNTIVTLTDLKGNCILWESCGSVGFKGTKKGTPFAASMCAKKVAEEAVRLGVRKVELRLKGPGPGRNPAIKSVKSAGLGIVCLKDVTPIPHGGCRPPKPRRV